MSFFDFEFVAPLERHELKHFGYTVVRIPGSLQDELGLDRNKRLRVDAEMLGEETNCAVQSDDGEFFLTVPKRLLAATDAKLGEEIRVRLNVADQKAVDVPQELLVGLAADERASAAWKKLTPGRRRSFAWMVRSAKRPETKQKRVTQVLGELAGRRRAKKRNGRFG